MARVPPAPPAVGRQGRSLPRHAPTTEIVDHALAAAAWSAADLLTGPDAERLTACGSTLQPVSAPPPPRWCSTRCGSRARAARTTPHSPRRVTGPRRPAGWTGWRLVLIDAPLGLLRVQRGVGRGFADGEVEAV